MVILPLADGKAVCIVL